MSKSYVIHEQEVHFDVEFNINGYFDSASPIRSSLRKGELYVSEGSIYLGKGDKWYKVNVGDIKNILSLAQQRKIELVFEQFSISLFTDNYSHLNALRDILCIVKCCRPGYTKSDVR